MRGPDNRNLRHYLVSIFERGSRLRGTLPLAPAPPLLLGESLLFNQMPYILDLIIMIMARMLGFALEHLMRYCLDEFNRASSTPKHCLSKKMFIRYHNVGL